MIGGSTSTKWFFVYLIPGRIFLVFYKQISLKKRVVWQKIFPNIIKLSRLSHKVIVSSALPGGYSLI